MAKDNEHIGRLASSAYQRDRDVPDAESEEAPYSAEMYWPVSYCLEVIQKESGKAQEKAAGWLWVALSKLHQNLFKLQKGSNLDNVEQTLNDVRQHVRKLRHIRWQRQTEWPADIAYVFDKVENNLKIGYEHLYKAQIRKHIESLKRTKSSSDKAEQADQLWRLSVRQYGPEESRGFFNDVAHSRIDVEDEEALLKLLRTRPFFRKPDVVVEIQLVKVLGRLGGEQSSHVLAPRLEALCPRIENSHKLDAHKLNTLKRLCRTYVKACALLGGGDVVTALHAVLKTQVPWVCELTLSALAAVLDENRPSMTVARPRRRYRQQWKETELRHIGELNDTLGRLRQRTGMPRRVPFKAKMLSKRLNDVLEQSHGSDMYQKNPSMASTPMPSDLRTPR